MKSMYFLLFLLNPLSLYGQATITDISANRPVATYELKSSSGRRMEDGSGRKVIMQRVKPLTLPLPPKLAAPAPVDPVVRAARRTAWAKEANKDRRILSVTGIYYPDGKTFLQWSMPDHDGKWCTYEAWTLMDLRAAFLVQEFEVNNVIYNVFASVHPASKSDNRPGHPGPLWFADTSVGFRLTKGDPTQTRAIEPIAALHQIFKEEGPSLTKQWIALKAAENAKTALASSKPEPIEDIVIKVYPLKSNLHPEAEAEAKKAERVLSPQAR